MSAKIILVTTTAEHVVATFKAPAEAFMCAALLQSKASNPNTHAYYVEQTVKGCKSRKRPDNINRYI